MNKYQLHYCTLHDQGYCLEDGCTKLSSEIALKTCGVLNCVGYHDDDHGILEIIGDKLDFTYYYQQLYYDRLCGGWKQEYFKNNIYDKELNNIILEKENK